jgi:hypothetical protein
VRFGPGLWPGPRRQARWAGRGLRGQRRAAGASRAAGCEAPLRPEGPARTMRGAPVSARRPRYPHGSRRIWRGLVALAVVLAGAAADTAGTAAAGHRGRRARQSPRRRACVRRTRRKLPPRNGETPRLNPGQLRRVTLAAHFRSTARAHPCRSRPGPSGLARRRCALETV